MRAARTLRELLLFAAAFLAASFGVRALLPWPAASGLRVKLEHYRDHADEYDVVVLGSSHVLCSVIAPRLEAALAERGHRLRVLNLGVPGAFSFEVDHLLDEVLALRSPRLKLVLVELAPWRPDPRAAEPTERNIAWHTPGRTLALIESAWSSPEVPVARRLDAAAAHARLGLRWLVNAGRIQFLAADALGLRPDDKWTDRVAEALAAEGGYLALEEMDNAGAEEGRARFLDDLPGYRARVEAIAAARRAPAESDPRDRGPAAAREARAEAAGVELVHVLLASDRPAAELHALAAEGHVDALWSFNRPAEHPDLYRLGARYDERHLSRTGAELLTDLLAERLARHLEEGGGG